MSYSLKITDGDLDASSGTMQRVTGLDKLVQDLSLWLREPYGIDRFHTLYGSVLDQYIGSVIDASSDHEIKSEVIRVINAFQQIQLIGLKKNPSKYTLDELLDSIQSVSVKLDYDRVYIDVRFLTASQQVGQVIGDVQL
jgi:phage baseplate assembly protein W